MNERLGLWILFFAEIIFNMAPCSSIFKGVFVNRKKVVLEMLHLCVSFDEDWIEDDVRHWNLLDLVSSWRGALR